MATKRIRIILDTNWYISATISKNSRRRFYELLINEKFSIIFCADILREYEAVISRDKFKKMIDMRHVNRFIDMTISKLEIVEITANVTGSRDINDNFLLSLSFDGHADYLITGDLDLLVLKQSGSTQIVTFQQFMDLISHKTQ